MPEPEGELLAELRIEGRQDAPWTRRIEQDGSVWEHSNLRTWIEAGQVRQEHQEPRWEHLTTAPSDALERIRAVVRDHGLMQAEPVQRPSGTVTGVGTTVWRLALDGAEHEIRLEQLPAERVPGLAELRQAMDLAVAMGMDAGAAP